MRINVQTLDRHIVYEVLDFWCRILNLWLKQILLKIKLIQVE